MDDHVVPTSPALLAANQRLHELRAQAQARRLTVSEDIPTAAGPLGEAAAAGQTAVDAIITAALPSHLGWGSAPLTAVLRRHQPAASLTAAAQPQDAPTPGTAVHPPTATHVPLRPPVPQPPKAEVKLYPDIGLAMLRQEKDAAGRLWLMLHHLDQPGRGVVRIDIIVQYLSKRTSSLYLCGQRQLRNLLRAGEGVYWTRDKKHVWLHSAARVAAALGADRLTGRPVALPLSALRQGIGTFRAHLYAAFHSGRFKGRADGRPTMPIARDTLADLSGVGRTSQRAYEARLGVQPQPNFAIGEAEAAGRQEERAWRQGQALFALKDYAGQHGREGKTYLAWQLPNSYAGQHLQRPKGRQKRINRQLQDLVMKGMPGNDGDGALNCGSAAAAVMGKRYYANGRLAAQRWQPGEGVRYWRRPSVEHGRAAIWHPVEGS
ncbi:MAG: hypothetical protein IPM39_26135 [Chloroflexi bacterium]|nr:hypothetical protein [Chloroflexota bacterium]